MTISSQHSIVAGLRRRGWMSSRWSLNPGYVGLKNTFLLPHFGSATVELQRPPAFWV